ncbi:unnamed protein product [Paramecium sonneborni]|uniref:Uncharacterized protein n=1 Tax=Paramecium sonneborni TaxID=65129 RepID=A0A8S1R9Z9_9CILI|nr:unnamed protein product [Paramecium sonneborni]CAD8125062.1 unnamed protein product [Paramecium sonneborni]
MGCSESTHHKSSLQLSQDSTLDTCRTSPIKPKPKPDLLDLYNFEDFDTSELNIEQTCFHFYDILLQKVVTVPKLQPITASTILQRRNDKI